MNKKLVVSIFVFLDDFIILLAIIAVENHGPKLRSNEQNPYCIGS